MMLETVETNWYQYEEELSCLADNWQRAGAAALYIQAAGEIVWQWPQQMPLASSTWTVDLPIEGQSGTSLCVAGEISGPVHQRLQADAMLLARAINLEEDVSLMAGALIESRDQLLAMYHLARSTRNQLEVDEALLSIVSEVTNLMKVQGAFAVLQAGKANAPLIANYPQQLLDPAKMLQLSASVTRTDQQYLVQGAEAKALLPAGISSLLVLPIRLPQGYVAGLGFINQLSGKFQAPHLKLARALAEQIGAQVEHILMMQAKVTQTRMQTELELAQKVQLQLLPQDAPRVRGVDLYARTVPALQVGGDFFDFTSGPDGLLRFAVGDVSGKGVSSALLMTMIRTVIRSTVSVIEDSSPAALLSRTNEHLYDDFTHVMMFATVFCGQYDPHSSRLTYANSGHSPVVFCPAAGTARLLGASATAIGVLPENRPVNESILLQPGDVLVVATDGFNEACNTADERFGNDRLMALIQAQRHLSASALADKLLETVAEFATGRQQFDDQTLIVIKGVADRG